MQEISSPDAIDTIAAIATPPGRGAIGVLRLSGPQAARIAAAMAGPLPPPRVAGLRDLRDDKAEVLDRGLVLHFPAPASYTGDDLVELQAHGGPVLMGLLLQGALVLGARAARPGEFSERAFLNGRLDLAQAEAVADLIDAGSAAAVRAAQRSLSGEFSNIARGLADEMLALRAWVEGALDFADEDVAWLQAPELRERLEALCANLARLLSQASAGRRLSEGLTVVIAGAPNVGKSTLLNRLAGADAAIVSDLPGTTRDLLREHILLGDLPLTVIDTAGLRETDDPVEREGIRRAHAALEQAELALYLIDDRSGLQPPDRAQLAALPAGLPCLLLHNKCDLSARAPEVWQEGTETAIRLSAETGAGLNLLTAALRGQAGVEAGSESAFSARARHLEALRTAGEHLDQVRSLLARGSQAELAAEELRRAHEALATLTGAVGSEMLLGTIFSRFCIGK